MFWTATFTRAQRRANPLRRAGVACAVASALLAGIAIGQQPDALPPVEIELQQPPELLPDVEPEGLTLPALEQMALSANPSVARAAAMVGAARGTWVQVGLPRNPSVGYEGQQIGSGGRAEQHGVLFNQEIIRPDKLRLNRTVASQEILVAEQEVAGQQSRVLTDVRIAFYQVLLAQQQIDLAGDLVGISTEGSRAAESLFKSQEGSRADLLQAQLEMENANILAENARNRFNAAWQQLTAVVGCPNLAVQNLVGDVLAPSPGFDYEDALARILAESPEVAAAVFEVTRAQAALERAAIEPLPNVNVQGLMNWQDNGIGGKADGGVLLTVPVPIFDRNQGAIRRAQQELSAARRAESQVELDLQNRLAPIFEQYANARNQVERYRETILPAADESLGLARKSYQAGESNYLVLLTSQRTYSQTHWNYFDAVRALRIAEVQISGYLLQGSLQSRGD